MINITAEYQALLESDAFTPCYLVKLPSLTVTSAPDTLAFNGDVYVSSGVLIAMDGIGATTEITAATYTITLDNAKQDALGLYGSSDYLGADVTVFLGMLDDDGSLIVDGNGAGPFEIYKGVFDGWAVAETERSSTMKIKVKSHWAAFSRKAGRYTNSASQQEVYPSDTFFEYAHEDIKDMRWMTKP